MAAVIEGSSELVAISSTADVVAWTGELICSSTPCVVLADGLILGEGSTTICELASTAGVLNEGSCSD